MQNHITAKKRGAQAEDLACRYLLRQGLALIARNYFCHCGEIDLIMKDKHLLIFIEVRYRHNSHFGNSLETVNSTKRAKLIKTAEYYLQCHPVTEETSYRFDVIGISPLVKPKQWYKNLNAFQPHTTQVEWVKNAFSR
jgi:putative endonuclease